MRLCLVEDSGVRALEPLTLTRPAFDLLLGSRTLGQKAARAFGLGWESTRRGSLVRPHLIASQLAKDPRTAVNDQSWLSRGPVLVVNARWVPPEDFQAPHVRRPTISLCDGQVACAWVGPGQARGLELQQVDAWFEEMATSLDAIDIGGEWVDCLDDLVDRNADHLARDFLGSRSAGLDVRQTIPGQLVGPSSRLHVHPTARIDRDTVFDTRGGPISIEAGVVIHSNTRIEGPCWVGENARLIHANLVGGVSLGAHSRIAGKIEQSILLGQTNKFDDGSLRHAYVGEWVNLGGVAPNYSHRSDSGEDSVSPVAHHESDERTRTGSFLGDHTHSSIGGFLDMGTEIGVMCTILSTGSVMPQRVPSFSVIGFGRSGPEASLDDVFETAEITMQRRGREFTEVQRQLYRHLYEQRRPDRGAGLLQTLEPPLASSRRPGAEARGLINGLLRDCG